ncbi:mediator of DNA damage checkpoint protein 1-like isoform X1, partial [Elysia marginata]
VSMDPDDFDQTQAIVLDDQDYNDDTDDLAPDGDKKPVSFLKVPLQKGLNETSYPIYEGDNIIGRNKDTCHVFIQSKVSNLNIITAVYSHDIAVTSTWKSS